MFDELGVDHIFIDEAHYFKNLETPTKMERVAGIQTGGSERAFDLYMKCRYLDQHPGHGVTFATGTPISNTMVEMYTIQRYLDPHGLAERGIDHFDAWAATFGEVVDTMEISPDGKTLRPRSRFAKFTNLPELQQMFRAFADVQTAEMLDLPRPRLEGGKPTTSSPARCPRRAHDPGGARRALRGDPRRQGEALGGQRPGHHHRRPQAGPRCPAAPCPATDDPGSKINALVENVAASGSAPRRARHAADLLRYGGQPDAWGYSVYEEVIDKLVKPGIPREQIAAIGDADTDAKKQALFEKVRAGTGAGAARQHPEDGHRHQRPEAARGACTTSTPPGSPPRSSSATAASCARATTNEEVAIYRYVTEGSFRRLYVAGPGDQGPVHRPGHDRRQHRAPGRGHRRPGALLRRGQGHRLRQPAVLTLAEADAETQAAARPEEAPRRRAVPRNSLKE